MPGRGREHAARGRRRCPARRPRLPGAYRDLQGASGALYYYGADDRTHLTITLPASRSEDSWIATNNGVTYSIMPENLMVTKPGITLADEALSSGWTR